MEILEIAEKTGVLFYRRRYGNGFRPHISMRIDGVDFHIDTSPGRGYNIITHAHTDHHGLRNIKNFRAIASCETSVILSAISGENFRGIVHEIGEKLEIKGIEIDTFPTSHMDGSSAYFFRDYGILVTGDVKRFEKLPECEILVTEATYGHPSNRFVDEIDRVVESARKGLELGAYPIGKAQRVARILVSNDVGFRVEDERISKLCSVLGIEHEEGDARIIPPKKVVNGYVLSAQTFYRNRIVFSDHIDYRGIIELIDHCSPSYVIFYHGNPTRKLLQDAESMGTRSLTLKDVDVHL